MDQSPHPDLEIDAKFDDLRELVKALPLSREQLRFALNWVIFAQQYWAKGEPAPARLHVETVCQKFAEEIATFCQDREFRELELFQGIWRPVSTVHDGRSMPDLVYRRAIVIGNTYFVFHAYKVDRWGTFKIGAEPCLRRIDTIPVIGNNAGGHVHGDLRDG